MSESERVTIQSSPNSARHYNVDNISYLQVLNLEYGFLAKLLLAFIVVGALGTGLILDSLLTVVIGVVFVLGLWFFLKPSDGVSIGTLASRDDIESDNPSQIEQDFSEKTPETIQVSGTINSLILKLDYQYRFLPQNMISVEHTESLYSRWILSLLIIGTVSLLLSAFTTEMIVVSNLFLTFGGSLLVIAGLYPIVKIRHVRKVVGTTRTIFLLLITLIHLGITVSLAFHGLMFTVWSLESGSNSDIVSIVGEHDVGMFFPVMLILAFALIIIYYLFPREGITLAMPNQETLYFQMGEEDASKVVSEFIDQ